MEMMIMKKPPQLIRSTKTNRKARMKTFIESFLTANVFVVARDTQL